MRGLHGRLIAVLLVLPVVPVALSAATAAAKDAPPVEFRLLAPSPSQLVETTGYDSATQRPEIAVPAKPDGLIENLAYIPESLGKSVDASASDDSDYLRDLPRSKMRKWFFMILFIGGLIRYFSSDSYRRFVSDVLDPLNW
jgi:hypothetical protein